MSLQSFWGLRKMIEGESYSDCTIKCGNEVFKAHRFVVCSQSEVIKKAFDGGFMEGTSHVFAIDMFSLDTVRRVMEFIYSQDYDLPEPRFESYDAYPEDYLKSDEFKLQDIKNPDVNNEVDRVDITEVVLQHVQVFAAAEYLSIPDLMASANYRIGNLLREPYTSLDFQKVIHEVSKATIDNTVSRSIAHAAAKMSDWPPYGVLESLGIDGFPLEFIEALMQLVRIGADKAAALDRETARVEAKDKELYEIKKDFKKATGSTYEDWSSSWW